MSAVERFTDPIPPRFYVVDYGEDVGWSVIEDAPGVYRIAAGPYASRETAETIADQRNRQWRASVVTSPADESGTDVLAGVADALRSLALQADRYDAALADIQAQLDTLRGHVLEVSRRLDALPGSGSVKA